METKEDSFSNLNIVICNHLKPFAIIISPALQFGIYYFGVERVDCSRRICVALSHSIQDAKLSGILTYFVPPTLYTRGSL